MPVYEYRCAQCGRRFSRFFWRISDAEKARCRCGSGSIEQLVSRVAMLKSEESRMESIADPAKWGDLNEEDPKSVARMMRKLGNEMGEDLGPEFGEAVDRLEAGEDPESVESSLGGEGTGSPDNLF